MLDRFICLNVIALADNIMMACSLQDLKGDYIPGQRRTWKYDLNMAEKKRHLNPVRPYLTIV